MKAPKRIAFDARYVSDRYHGIGRFAFRLLEAIVALDAIQNRQWQVVIYRGKETDSRFDWNELLSQPNVEVHEGPWPLYWPHEQLVWPRLLQRSRIDLFYSPYFIAPLLTRIPRIITVHDLIFDRYPDYMPQRWARPYYRMMMDWGTRRARRVVAVSAATAGDLINFYEVPPDKIAVIPEGVDPDYWDPQAPEETRGVCARYKLRTGFILAVGTRRPHKNLDQLVRAFARLDAEIAPQLVFAGPPDPRFPDQALRAVEEIGLNGRVRFLDWVPETDLPKLYAAASLVVLPSLVEGFGLPVLEAMASGTPVIASNASSLPEIIGEAGILVDSTDLNALVNAITGLLGDEARRLKLRAAGWERAAQFTWQRSARGLLDAILLALQ